MMRSKKRRKDAQKILDGLKADPDGDFSEIAKSVDDSYSSLSGTFDANETSEDEDTDDEDAEDADDGSSSYSGTYPEEVIDVLRTLRMMERLPPISSRQIQHIML